MSYKILKGKELEEHLKRVKEAIANNATLTETLDALKARKKKNEIPKEDE